LRTTPIYITLALVIAVGVGFYIQSDIELPEATISGSLTDPVIVAADRNAAKNIRTDLASADIDQLNRLLQNEIRARQALQKKFEALARQMSDLEANMQSIKDSDNSDQATNDANAEIPDPGDNWFNENALIDSGMSSGQASELKAYFEQLEIERLYLRDQSIREQWDRAKYREAIQVLANKEDDLRNSLSDSEYDAYLYASGQANRVAVTSVLASAQAGTAGIKPGDHIIRYDNQRIYNGFDLREATASGSIGDTVALEVERDGQTLQFYLPRGPLGIRMNSVSAAP
jgi:C-terminal processing protease CtpA/Prc